jgi:hypothetical protein
MNMSSKQRLISLAAIILLAVLIIVGGTYLQRQKGGNKINNQTKNDRSLQPGVKQEAKPGEPVTEYPLPLIPQDKSATLENSYNLKDDHGTIERNASFTSDQTVKQVYDYYLNLIESSGNYRIVNKTFTEAQANIYADRPEKSDISVFIKKDTETGKTFYSVTYLDKN